MEIQEDYPNYKFEIEFKKFFNMNLLKFLVLIGSIFMLFFFSRLNKLENF